VKTCGHLKLEIQKVNAKSGSTARRRIGREMVKQADGVETKESKNKVMECLLKHTVKNT